MRIDELYEKVFEGMDASAPMECYKALMELTRIARDKSPFDWEVECPELNHQDTPPSRRLVSRYPKLPPSIPPSHK